MSSTPPPDTEFNALLDTKVRIVNSQLTLLLSEQQGIQEDLRAALAYTLSAPGKRIRAALVLWSCEAVAEQNTHEARIAAAAIEMVHTYSLVHDDLPAMDDDDLRRGWPTCHKAFGEATAILTGDALLTLAFEVLASRIRDPWLAMRLTRQLAEAAGGSGMIAGQMADLKAERTAGSVEVLEYIHTNKTAKMFRCAAVMGGMCGQAEIAQPDGAPGRLKGGAGQLDALAQYGLKIGLGFQIADDILDVSASSEQLGKTAGKDIKANKCTYPAVIGIEKSRELEQTLAREAVEAIEPLGPAANPLRQLAQALLAREK
ncbi:MAG: polyprenyl synthetase family protein [Sedimentisphaerales bacterium]|nr:polyprenyl synthetase family protein [Sedimentisphaerales bacterium]